MQSSLFWQLHVSYLHLWGKVRHAVNEGSSSRTRAHTHGTGSHPARGKPTQAPPRAHVLTVGSSQGETRGQVSGSARRTERTSRARSGDGQCPRGSHPPCNTPRGPRLSGTCRRGSLSSSAGSTSAPRSWLQRRDRASAGAGPSSRSPEPRCLAAQAGTHSVPWSPVPSSPMRGHTPTAAPRSTCPDPVGGKARVMSPDQPLGEGHHPVISEQAWPLRGDSWRAATVDHPTQPRGRKQQLDRLASRPPAPSPTRPTGPAGRPVHPAGPSLTALDVEGAGVLQPVQLVVATRLGLPRVGEAGPRGLHQPARRLEVIPFQAVEVPAEA